MTTAQQPETQQPTDLLALAVATARRNPYGFLASADDAGRPHVRLTQHLAVDDDATVWIGTSPRSRKVADIAGAPEVGYAIEDRAALSYVTLYGRARLVDDRARCLELWDDELGLRFFPDGPTGGDFALLELVPHRIELVDFTARVTPEPYGLVPAVIEKTEAGWEPRIAQRATDQGAGSRA
ncbi:pyridoxamine 5'-phosphate oxidase family protein [Streptomyces sp. NBC_01481]|uniref:pyridoxamine 5'-phosphate oxidase family protein n=1 Tax=Streptomyces sp. NBC_01481 TaxID=2975869 RepID=UPI0022527C72|nr:pyridoxamine 5'-phosphate oxidase family protein [Streptomyces sp. NBC_01481]MCX4587162.1 pyridoxamine 5'-phosphate oxidase family protein [Streptomyces sp. NBC_01481]